MSALTAAVAVVGGGLVGTAVAYELVSAGADVVLIDAHHEGRATDAGAGILSPETTWNPDPGWFSFAMAAGAHYRTLVERLAADGAPDTGYDTCGLLLVAAEPGEDDWFATRADLARRRCPDRLTEITPEEARRRFPPLGPVRRALSNPAAARVDGRLMNAALLHGAEQHGLRRLAATATGLRIVGTGIVGVDTDAGSVASGAVVIAGGAWSSTFGRQLRLQIPVKPVKGQIVHMQLPAGADGADGADGGGGSGDGRGSGSGSGGDSGAWPIVSPVFTHYLVAWPGGRVACGGTYEADAGFDVRPTVAGLEELLRASLALAPGLAGAAVTEVRVGLRPVSGDDLPVLGPVPGWDNLHLVTGHGTEGLLLGPYSAAVVAGCALGQPVPDELRAFSVSRFP